MTSGAGGGGERRDARVRHAVAKVLDPPVVGPEIVPPLADAVRLIHHQPRDAHAVEQAEERAAAKALGRHVEQLDLARHAALNALALLGQAQAAVDEVGRRAQPLQFVHLVLHQRDERRDDQRQPVGQQRGKLEDERFAAAGGHDDERVAPREHGGDGVGLPLAKRGVAEHPVHQFARAVERGGRLIVCGSHRRHLGSVPVRV